MPLPTDARTPWPPENMRQAYAKYAEHGAWYSGDPNQIASAQQSAVHSPTPKGRFWSREIGEERRVMLHVPMAGDIASVSADLMLSEAPRIRIPDAHSASASPEAKKAQDRLDIIINEGGIHNRLIEGAESGAALGGVFLKPNWDRDLVGFPIMSVVQADNAVPEFKWGFLVAVTFWRVLHDDGEVVWRHLERHEHGAIFNGVFKGDRDMLGYSFGLESFPETADLQSVMYTGIDDILARYVPNMRPNRMFRGSHLGQSDYMGTEGLMDALDEVYTSWIRDIRLAQGRIIVPESWLERDRNGNPRFDMEREIYTTLDVDPLSAGNLGATINQFDIRTNEHMDAALELINRIVSSAGYSPQSFGLRIAGTAESGTALNIRERRSMMTKSKKERYFKPAIEDMLYMMMLLDKSVFGTSGEIYRPSVEFADSITYDVDTVANSVETLNRAQAVTVRTKIRMIHPDWTEEQIEQEAVGIMEEQGIMTNSDMDLPD